MNNDYVQASQSSSVDPQMQYSLKSIESREMRSIRNASMKVVSKSKNQVDSSQNSSQGKKGMDFGQYYDDLEERDDLSEMMG